MDYELKIHTLISHLPLFQGMSLAELDNVIAKVPLGFATVGQGEVIAAEGQPADRLVFIIQGDVRVVTYADDRGYSIEEWMQVPCVLQPERLFGLRQHFSRTFYADADCRILYLEKSEAMKLTTSSEIFRLNLMNIVCTMAQRSQRQPWHSMPKDIRHKVFEFLKNRCMRPAGRKTVNIGMVRLAQELHESRLNVSRELNRMHSEGIIRLTRGRIIFDAFEKSLS